MDIQAAIGVHDMFSEPLRNMSNALNMTISSFEQLQDTSSNAVDLSALQSARDELAKAEIAFDNVGDEIKQAEENQRKLNDSLNEGTIAAGGLESKLLKIVATYATMKTANAVLNISDTMVETTARLNLMNDGLQTTKDLQNMIYLSAQNSRSEYQATADMVSQLGLNAKDAFSSNVELIRFAEQLNKSMVIAGASGMAAESTIYNLTQALSTGVLRGQDLNAVLSNSPNIVQNIADYLDVPIGKIKDMAADGQVTAEIVKNAMLAATDATNAAFESMPMTFGQIATSIKNDALMAFEPVLARLNEIANSEQFQVMVDGIITSMVFVAGVVIEIFDLVGQVGSFIADNWSILEPIIIGAATALGLYTLALMTYNGIQLVTNVIQGIAAIQASVHAASLMLQSGATFAATVAQHGFNAALLACPITWVIAGIVLIIGVIFAAVAAFNKLAGASYSAMGVIVGSVAVAGAFIFNTFLGVINAVIQMIWTRFVEPFIGIIEWVLNVANGGFNSFGDAVANLIGNIISWFLSLGKVVTTIIDAIFGTNWTAGLSSLQDSVLAWGKNENSITLERNAPTIGSRIDYGNAWDSGYELGANIGNSVKDFFSFGTDEFDIEGYLNSQKGGLDSLDPNMPGGIGSDIKDIADNTKGINDKLKATDEDIKYLRDLAANSLVNRFTTNHIEVTQHNDMKVDNQMDLDGVINDLATGIEETLDYRMEGIS